MPWLSFWFLMPALLQQPWEEGPRHQACARTMDASDSTLGGCSSCICQHRDRNVGRLCCGTHGPANSNPTSVVQVTRLQDRGAAAGRGEGKLVHHAKEAYVNDLPEGCYGTVRKDAALGALTRDELSSKPARTQSKFDTADPPHSTWICDGGNPARPDQSGSLKPPHLGRPQSVRGTARPQLPRTRNHSRTLDDWTAQMG